MEFINHPRIRKIFAPEILANKITSIKYIDCHVTITHGVSSLPDDLAHDITFEVEQVYFEDVLMPSDFDDNETIVQAIAQRQNR